MNSNADRGSDMVDQIQSKNSKLVGLTDKAQMKLGWLSKDDDPIKTSNTVREILAGKETDLTGRRVLHQALMVADDKQGALSHTARAIAHMKGVPDDCKKQLKLAVSEVDCAAEVLIADVRKVLMDLAIPPATRHALNVAHGEAANRYITLAESARSHSRPSSDLPSDRRTELSDAVGASSGRTAELYHVARAAAHNPRLPAEVRQVLREALGSHGLLTAIFQN
eukprot:gene21577-33196_t